MSDQVEFAEVYRGHEPVEAQMLEDILRKEGFTPRLLGTRNAALMGAGQNIMAMRIEVPTDEASEARQLVESVLDQEVETPYGEDDYEGSPPEPFDGGDSVDRPEEASEDVYRPPRKLETGAGSVEAKEGEPPRKPKNRVLALGVVAAMPGLSQVYAGRPWSGLFLMIGLAITFVVTISQLDTFVLGMAYLGSIVVDIFAGQRAVSAYNRGRKTVSSTQILYGVIQVAIVQVFAYGVSFIPGRDL